MALRTDVELPGPEEELLRATLRMNGRVLGLVLGGLCGLGLFVATNWLVLKGGYVDATGREVVGPHLSLLSQYLLGYRVSFLGSLVGFGYAFALGWVTGRLIGWVYNRVVDLDARSG